MNTERYPVECNACDGTGWSPNGWLPSGGECATCKGRGSKLMTDAERYGDEPWFQELCAAEAAKMTNGAS